MMLRRSNPEIEGLYQGSKWIKFQVLVEKRELEPLFESLEPFAIFPLSGFTDGKEIEKNLFLETVDSWANDLKEGKLPEEGKVKKLVATAFTQDPDSLWLQEIPTKGYLVKVAKPILQVQTHYFTYSPIDEVFRPMSMGEGSIFWGLQFAFPQIYQDPKTHEFKEAENRLLPLVRKWVRNYTAPTPFVAQGKRTNAPIRLGKSCFPWIKNHPQLETQNIQIVSEIL